MGVPCLCGDSTDRIRIECARRAGCLGERSGAAQQRETLHDAQAKDHGPCLSSRPASPLLLSYPPCLSSSFVWCRPLVIIIGGVLLCCCSCIRFGVECVLAARHRRTAAGTAPASRQRDSMGDGGGAGQRPTRSGRVTADRRAGPESGDQNLDCDIVERTGHPNGEGTRTE